MARARSLCCFVSPTRGKPSDVKTRRSTAACICCIGPHHKPSGAGGLGPNAAGADLSARSPLIGCCGSGENVRGRTPTRTPTARRRLCGARSRTPRRAPASSARVVVVNAAAPAARTPRTPTTPLGRKQQQRGCCVQGNAKLGRRRSWFRSARQAVVAQQQQNTPRFPAGRDGGNSGGVKVHDARVAEVEARQAAAAKVVVVLEEEEACSIDDEYAQLCREGFSREDVAAVTIQAFFRGHLARRACKALKSLVRIQAVARGAYVRRQAEVAIHCMQAMVRLQVRVRARQMLTKPKDKEGQLLLQS
ncbi:hypothetical protein PR202_gb18504 [Eleusine coracana subsp. coracana]|uniref:Uncharacterized protein n=1 Tax=Eleusine coracana subsp. coracana TaxID=191504 RepID=A0AAV5F5H8_ELECO|nr:hypothetical protein QOZ80_3BG0295210 [Eleusine coracana subsp. coracana]GJN30215.1 hypothetical protein PR202_gb18504 [Eleusine coracana subsp. coracana]